MVSEYIPNYKYVDVLSWRKYSPDHPLPRIMQNLRQQTAPRTTTNLDLNSGSSTPSQVQGNLGCDQRSMGPTVEEDTNLHLGIYPRLCPKTRATVAMVLERRQNGKEYKRGSKRFLFDHTADYYDWLPCGWLCEERIMATGRLYRYYYSPKGSLYDSKLEALGAMSR